MKPEYPAFPLPKDRSLNDDGKEGMSKRFYAACAAMQGLLASGSYSSMENCIADAYAHADELLKQENKGE